MIHKDDIVINIVRMEANKIQVSCSPVADSYLYAFQLYYGEEMVDRILYSKKNEGLFYLPKSGEYAVRACVKEGLKSVGKMSEPLQHEYVPVENEAEEVVYNSSIPKEKIEISIEMKEANKMYVSCSPIDGSCQYAFQLYCGEELVDRILYSEQNEALFWLSRSGEYTVHVAVKIGQKSTSKVSEPVQYTNPALELPPEEESKVGPIAKVKLVTREIVSNFSMLCRIARYDYKLLNKDSYLGKLWSILTPLIQIATYWLVFGVGIRSNSTVDEHPFLLWMLCGLVPWFFINESILKGANSIYSKAGVVTKMKYPISTVPVGVVVTALMEHVVVLVILFVTFLVHGYFPNLYYLNLIYYMIYSFVFLCSLAMITSVLTMLARDFQKLLTSIIRLVFYVTPILWSMEKMPQIYKTLIEYTPVYYVVYGFRDSLLYKVNFWSKPDKILFFWGLNLVLYLVGCVLQYKYRKKFNDLM